MQTPVMFTRSRSDSCRNANMKVVFSDEYLKKAIEGNEVKIPKSYSFNFFFFGIRSSSTR